MLKKLLENFGSVKQSKKNTIIRVQYGRLGQVLLVSVKISSGDQQFDQRGIDFVKNTTHPNLHHPGKRKSARLNQWYEIRYCE